jgi:hypothetical protein
MRHWYGTQQKAHGATKGLFPMRSKLLITTAALLAGVAIASAQSPGGGQSGGGQGGGAMQSQGGAPGGAAGQSGQDRQTPQRNQGQSGQDKQGQSQQRTQDQRGQRDSCLNDYLVPWRGFENSTDEAKNKMTADRVKKFRPVNPVVYPAVAAKLGLLPRDALFPVVEFYFRLDALRREIDNVTADYGGDNLDLVVSHRPRLRLIATRLRDSLGPAAVALEKLDVPGSAQIDSNAARAYPHVANLGDALRDGLRKGAVK